MDERGLISVVEWDMFFEAFWPKTTDAISQLLENIRKHRMLMCEEVTLEHIIQALSARQVANEAGERTRDLQESQLFHSLYSELKVSLYDTSLETITKACSANAGEWIQRNGDYKKWADPNNKKSSRFWLQGIPGAGQPTPALHLCKVR